MCLNELAKKIHDNASKKGFHANPPLDLGTLLMMVVSELSECLEADRHDKWLSEFHKSIGNPDPVEFELHFKNTVEDEIADAIIRLLDICDAYNIDIDKRVEQKMRYNETRPEKHGKKY